MATPKTDVLVYAHWKEMQKPQIIGTLTAQQAKGRKAFSFQYDKDWLSTDARQHLDPDLGFYSGPQYPNSKENFGIIMDSMPDTWGRKLMLRREIILAHEEGRPIRSLYEIDFLLGVNDETRIGALRFKVDPDGDFLQHDKYMATPPWTTLRELQHAADVIERDEDVEEIKKCLTVLLAPGSSLGGARPKANVIDPKGNLWIAKFPSTNDVIDKGAWEFLAYQLAIACGITMPSCAVEKVSGRHHTFFTQRFDRQGPDRIHFASAMTMTGYAESKLIDAKASYLDIAEFIQYHGAQNKQDLIQLWRRIIFHIGISNTDDHLRNHGFLLTNRGWVLSPAFDINPSVDKDGLALNIDAHQGDLDFDLAKSIGVYFQLSLTDMDVMIDEVKTVVKDWPAFANKIGISRGEQEMMRGAFRW